MERALSMPEGIKGAVEIIEPTRTERAIARRAAESRATVPDLSLSVEIDMTAVLAVTAESSGSFRAALVRATAVALGEHPRANGSYRDGRFELYSRVNAGVVLPSSETATVLDADQKALEQLAAEIEDLERRAAELTSPELSGATFTIAHYEVTRAEAVITPPHAVALAAGEVREVHGSPVMALALSCDLRIVSGNEAAALLSRIRALLQRGEL
jgi:pyruvate dehydrogenase E2 component (dihydrolipoamide acetyltransferase)